MTISAALLQWYDQHRRVLPWRALPGEQPDPYRVWLSEIMLQQTTVATVLSRFPRFLTRWPRLEELARADLDEVLFEWQGLGYYSRARNLLACAKKIMADHDGRFPDGNLNALPGIGSYTEAAIRAIAFGHRLAAIDANAERVIARLFRLVDKKQLVVQADQLVPADRPGDFAQALMDLGSMVCVTGIPKCLECPLREQCHAFAAGDAASFPVKKKKAEKPHRYAIAYWMEDKRGAIAIQKRPEKGLLGGLMEIPTSEWRNEQFSRQEAQDVAPLDLDWKKLPGQVTHVFTHFSLEINVWKAKSERAASPYQWYKPEDFSKLAFSSLMSKVIRHALG